MTFQQAQVIFSAIAASVRVGSSAAELGLLQDRLRALQLSIRDGDDGLEPINNAIIALAPRLHGLITRTVVDDLSGRTAMLAEATALLDNTAARAARDSRTLNLTQPKLLAIGLTTGLGTLRELRIAVAANDLKTASTKAEALFALFAQLQSTIKEV